MHHQDREQRATQNKACDLSGCRHSDAKFANEPEQRTEVPSYNSIWAPSRSPSKVRSPAQKGANITAVAVRHTPAIAMSVRTLARRWGVVRHRVRHERGA